MVLGWTTSSSSDKFTIRDLEAGENIVEVFHLTEYAQNGPLRKHKPYKTPKDWRKNSSVWKNIKEHFYVLTNKRWIFVNYDDRTIIEYFDLAEYDVLPGSNSITFMKGTENSFSVGLGDNLRIVQIIKHLQSSLNGSTQSQNITMQNPQPLSEDPLKVLKIRFAKGEISKEEFEEMRSLLE